MVSCRDGSSRVVDTLAEGTARALPGVNQLGYAGVLPPTDGSVAVGVLDGEVRRVVMR